MRVQLGGDSEGGVQVRGLRGGRVPCERWGAGPPKALENSSSQVCGGVLSPQIRLLVPSGVMIFLFRLTSWAAKLVRESSPGLVFQS